MSNRDDLVAVAKRVVWFKTPEETLREPKLFLSYVMTYGTLKDIVITMRHYSDEDFDRVLTDPPSGIFDVRSWSYWNLRYHHEPVPPLPLRTFSSTDKS